MSMQKKKLLKKTEKRLQSILEELRTFAEENNITLKEALDIQLIDTLRGISYRLYEGFTLLRRENLIK